MHSESCSLSTCPHTADSLSASQAQQKDTVNWLFLWTLSASRTEEEWLVCLGSQGTAVAGTHWISCNWKRVMSWCWTRVENRPHCEKCVKLPLYPASPRQALVALPWVSATHTGSHPLSKPPETVPFCKPHDRQDEGWGHSQAELSPRTQSSSSTAVRFPGLIWKDRRGVLLEEILQRSSGGLLASD